VSEIAEFSLNIDQALIWIATRREDLVNDAGDDLPARHRLTWVSLPLELIDDDAPVFVCSTSEAEVALLGVVRNGELDAWQDGELVKPAWFFGAHVKNFLIGPSLECGEHMRFERRRDVPHLVWEANDGSRAERRWEQIAPRFRTSELLAAFPSAAVVAQRAAIDRSRSGAPGRPTSIQLVRLEFQRRVANGELEGSVTREAEHLSCWLATRHPGEPQLKPKSIKNNISAEYRAARGA